MSVCVCLRVLTLFAACCLLFAVRCCSLFAGNFNELRDKVSPLTAQIGDGANFDIWQAIAAG